MAKTLEGMTLDTVSDALRKEGIRPGQRFSITVADSSETQTSFAEIAERMRATAMAQGLTTEIFDTLIAQPG
ncbi:MAG TPA: hypothetical protein VH020_00960 [Stellaceae bacterium]|jgi:hypothetical protein|nr:hypothetical protein [Stellaceae bacterium]